jgi:hypothetical protein
MNNTFKGVVFLIFGLFLLSACSGGITTVETRTIQMNRPAAIVSSPDQLSLREVNWNIITPENFQQRINQQPDNDRVLFAVTSEGFRSLSLNLSDVRALIEQQQRIIAAHEKNRN